MESSRVSRWRRTRKVACPGLCPSGTPVNRRRSSSAAHSALRYRARPIGACPCRARVGEVDGDLAQAHNAQSAEYWRAAPTQSVKDFSSPVSSTTYTTSRSVSSPVAQAATRARSWPTAARESSAVVGEARGGRRHGRASSSSACPAPPASPRSSPGPQRVVHGARSSPRHPRSPPPTPPSTPARPWRPPLPPGLKLRHNVRDHGGRTYGRRHPAI